jgi:hypothetical protein
MDTVLAAGLGLQVFLALYGLIVMGAPLVTGR